MSQEEGWEMVFRVEGSARVKALRWGEGLVLGGKKGGVTGG